MRFSCDRCGKRYATKDVPLPGRVYRLKCRACGNVVVVKGDDFVTSGSPRPEPPPPAAEPSAVTPLSDLASPAGSAPPPIPRAGLTASPEAAARPEVASASAPPAEAPSSSESSPVPPPVPAGAPEARYIELFDERDFSDDRPAPAPPPPEPIPPPARTPAGAGDTAPPAPVVSPEELREAAESLRPTLVDPFAHSGEFEPAPVAQDVVPSHLVRPPPTPGPARAVSVTHEARPQTTSRRPATGARRRGRGVWIGSVAVLLVAGAGVAVFSLWPDASPPAGAGEGHFPSVPAPATAPRSAADEGDRPPRGEKVAAQPAAAKPTPAPPPSPTPAPAPDAAHGAAPAGASAAAPPAPEASPAESPSEGTAKPAADAPPPPRTAAKPAPPPRAAPPKPAERPARSARPAKPERVERTVAAAARHDAPDAGAAAAPPPAAAPLPAAAPAPDADEPTGLTHDQVQRALAGGKKAFDGCLRDPWRGLDQPPGSRQITLRFTVAPEGTVGYATIDDVTISGAPVGQCLKAAARALTFPSFQGDPVKVDAPITIPAR